MSRASDSRHEMDAFDDDPRTDAVAFLDLLSEPTVADFVASLRALAGGSAPEPSPELAALLAGGLRRARARRAAVAVGAGLAVAVGASGIAAADPSFPSTAQRVVSRVANALTPGELSTRDHGHAGSAGPAMPTSASEPADGAASAGEVGHRPVAAAQPKKSTTTPADTPSDTPSDNPKSTPKKDKSPAKAPSASKSAPKSSTQDSAKTAGRKSVKGDKGISKPGQPKRWIRQSPTVDPMLLSVTSGPTGQRVLSVADTTATSEPGDAVAQARATIEALASLRAPAGVRSIGPGARPEQTNS